MTDTPVVDGLRIHSEYARQHQIGERTFGSRCSLADMVAELDRWRKTKSDFVLDSRAAKVVCREDDQVLCYAPNQASPETDKYFPEGPIPLGYDALGQVGYRVVPEVPTRYLRKLTKERPEEAARHLTALMHKTDRLRLVRVLDNRVRAYLSNRYRIFDDYDIALAALDTLRKYDGEVLEAQLTDRHMRLKMTTRAVWDVIHTTRSSDDGNWYAGALGNQQLLTRVAARRWDDLPGGPDTVTPLVSLSHSGTGHGGLNIRLGILAGVCFNLATVENVVSERHIGGEMDEGILTDETREADSRAIMLKARDYITTAFEPDRFKALVAKIRSSQEDVLSTPVEALDHVIKVMTISPSHRDALLSHFLKDYEPTRFGLAQAVGRLAQDVDSPDESTRLEDAAGELLMKHELVAV